MLIIDSLIILISIYLALNVIYLNDAKTLYIEIFKHLDINNYSERVLVKVVFDLSYFEVEWPNSRASLREYWD
jgi:hypothetical protein